MTDESSGYAHPSARFSLSAPEAWEAVPGLIDEGVVFVEPASESSDGFRSNVNVTVVASTPGELDVLADQTVDMLARTLTDFQLLDLEQSEFAGHAGWRLLGAYRQGIDSLVIEQWSAPIGDRVITLTGTCPAVAYDQYADQYAAVAASLRADGD